jgi:hypothetical protein
MKKCIRFIPRADLDAHTAAGSLIIPYPHTRAFFNSIGPFFITIVNNLISMAYRPGWTLTGALVTLAAEILETKINGFVYGHRKVGCHHGCLETRPQERVDNNISDPRHLPKTGQQ